MAIAESLLVEINADTSGLKKEMTQASKSVKSFQGQMGGLGGVMSRNRAVFQQVGYQVGDFAVQVGSGTSAIIAFTQQGSQLLGVLGPYGAIAGAALAITAPLAASFFNAGKSAGGAGDMVKKLNEQLDASRGYIIKTASDVDNLKDKYGELTDRTRKLLEIQVETSKLKLTEKMFETFKDTSVLNGIENMTWAVGQSNYKLAVMAQNLGITRNDLDALVIAQDRLTQATGLEEKAAAYKNLGDVILAIDPQNASQEFLNLRGAVAKGSLTFLEYDQVIKNLSGTQTDLVNNTLPVTEAVKKQGKAVQEEADAMSMAMDLIDAQFAELDKAEARRIAGIDDHKAALEELKAAEKEHNKLMQEGSSLTDSLRTPQEKYDDEIMRLNELLQEAAIGQETYERAVAAAQDELDGAAKKTQDVQNAWQDVGDTFASSFEDAIASGKGLSDVLSALEQDLLRLGTQYFVTAPLESMFSSMASGTSPTDLLGGATDLFGSLFSFAGGGDTGMGARTGGVDGKGGFPAIVHPNETVVDNVMGGGAGTVVNQYFTIYAQDANSFRASEKQITDDMRGAVQGAF